VTERPDIEVSVHVDARPETVFAYFTDPARYAQWMGTAAILEAVPGGTYAVQIRDGVRAEGRFVEVDPPRRIVFTWGWRDHPVAPGSTRVEVTFEAVDGGTRVVLQHSGLPDAAQVDQHRQGWELYLGRLVVAASGGSPGPDPHS
jgi:uncharacterized protein YndB with AHSA1/START domain